MLRIILCTKICKIILNVVKWKQEMENFDVSKMHVRLSETIKNSFCKAWKAKNDFSVNFLVENLSGVYAYRYMVKSMHPCRLWLSAVKGGGIANNGFIPVFTKSINLFLQGNTVYLKILEMLYLKCWGYNYLTNIM